MEDQIADLLGAFVRMPRCRASCGGTSFVVLLDTIRTSSLCREHCGAFLRAVWHRSCTARVRLEPRTAGLETGEKQSTVLAEMQTVVLAY